MSGHSCEAVIVSCIDFRFQEYINQWTLENFQPKTYDRVALAGGVKDFEAVLKQLEVSHRLHHTHKAILINHKDCGAYGEKGTAEKHAQNLNAIKEKIRTQFPDMEVNLYYLHLDGTFEKI